MTDKKQPEQVVEETTEVASKVVSEETIVVEESPTAQEVKPEIDYLNPQIFDNIKIVSKRELDESTPEAEISQELKQLYFNTISDISENQVITGRIIGLNDKEVLVDIGFKSEGIINRNEFHDEIPKIGEKMEVFLEYIEDRSGKTVLSKEKADFMRRWREIKEYFDNEEIITGKIVRRIKGGMIVDLNSVQAFLPGSQIDVRPVQDFDRYLDQEIELRIVKLNETRKNIVVSHKIILEESLKEQREALFDKLEAGQVLEGRVKNITDFGVFIDLGGIDGLLHITDLSWGRVNHPSEAVAMDDTLMVKVIDYDKEKKRVSLGLKQLTPHPWEDVETKYPIESTIKGKVVSMTNYGVFVEIEPGVEGLIHVSEMSWTRHVRNPSELFSMGDEVDAMVLSIDSDERKISLGAKQLQPDPWDEIEDRFMIGTVQKGKVINLTQFGAFVELAEGIDGLIHVSDLSWTKVIRHPKEIVEKNQDVEVRVLEVSRESRRISLGLRQVSDDPWPEIIQYFTSGKQVEGEVIRVLDKGIILQLEQDVEGIIPITKLSKRDRKGMARKYKPGSVVSGVVMEVKPDDKKVILFVDDLTVDEKKGKTDDVSEFLDNQEKPASEKIEIPDALNESEDESSAEKEADKPEAED
ncbi:MAG: 30S ribosomal protein S1 [Candidatus Marinimicrobia bacterium]|nr:30S ribosomal protein S1 [Candidatus Neomarinimicrobiota bacterium]